MVVQQSIWSTFLTLFSFLQGLGRIALISFTLSAILSVHVILLITILAESYEILPSIFLPIVSHTRFKLFFRWILFVIVMCTFHLTEFFVTALFNPSVVNASSFVVNHSKAYTSAILVSYILSINFKSGGDSLNNINCHNFLSLYIFQVALVEFWIKFLFFPWMNSDLAFYIGAITVFSGQVSCLINITN